MLPGNKEKRGKRKFFGVRIRSAGKRQGEGAKPHLYLRGKKGKRKKGGLMCWAVSGRGKEQNRHEGEKSRRALLSQPKGGERKSRRAIV